MKNTKIVVNTGSKSYPIYFGNGILNIIGKLIKKNLPDTKKICIIQNTWSKKVYLHNGEKCRCLLDDHNFLSMRPFSIRKIPLESPRRELSNGIFLVENGFISKKL